jgi:hypothetical protein
VKNVNESERERRAHPVVADSSLEVLHGRSGVVVPHSGIALETVNGHGALTDGEALRRCGVIGKNEVRDDGDEGGKSALEKVEGE